jgi:major membrane immunogen (membrane-anchored lipoprotein)
MNRIARLLAATAVLAALALLGGCGDKNDDPAEVDYPESAVILKQNVPQQHGEYRLVAINIDEEGGTVVVELPAGGNEKLPVKKGDTVKTSDGKLSLEVLDIKAPGDDDDAPGQRSGEIVVDPTP